MNARWRGDNRINRVMRERLKETMANVTRLKQINRYIDRETRKDRSEGIGSYGAEKERYREVYIYRDRLIN